MKLSSTHADAEGLTADVLVVVPLAGAVLVLTVTTVLVLVGVCSVGEVVVEDRDDVGVGGAC